MSEALDRIEKRGIEQGIKQGIKQGIRQGEMNYAKKVVSRLNKKGLPIQDIADVVEMDINTVSFWIQNMSDDD